MGTKKQNIKTLASKDAQPERGEIENRVVFTLYCKDVIDGIKKQLAKKPMAMKQAVVVSLLLVDEPTRKEILELVRENKKFDKTLEGFITTNKKKIMDFFQNQKDKTSTTAVLKQRIAELEAQVGDKK
ncbi:hypothetical protein HYT53_04550 [Candidatus Woesearchaeota archaeon]|nr:hypothetical protein [Candidatus Woesearchaeota archaeon]